MTKSKIQYSFERLKREFPLPIAIGRRGRRGMYRQSEILNWTKMETVVFQYF